MGAGWAKSQESGTHTGTWPDPWPLQHIQVLRQIIRLEYLNDL